MEVIDVLHMKGGSGDNSYAQNSLVQKKVISMTKPIAEEAITNLYFSKYPTTSCITIADLGCSSGSNTLFTATELIKVIEKIRRELDQESPEYHVFLNDLPGNDFNNIFKGLPEFHVKLKQQMGDDFGPCFLTGVPGSFYGRLFPSNSLHFVHSNYSLQWLSQVPEEIGEKDNKGNIYMASTSPPKVLKAYYDQFQKDFSMFLKCRLAELVSGGRMVLTILGRKSSDPTSKDGCYIWELMAEALRDMVAEGLIEEEKLNGFNIPQYTPSPSEVKKEIQKNGCFTINELKVTEVNWDARNEKAHTVGAYNVAKCMRSVAEPLLVSHFGDGIIEEVFRRYRDILIDCMAKEKTKFINIIISVIRI